MLKILGALAMTAAGVLAAEGWQRHKGSRGKRYEASEWVDFFTDDKARASTKKLAKRFELEAWEGFTVWLEHVHGGEVAGLAQDDFDLHDIAYQTYATLAGEGVGLWDGELFWELGVKPREETYKLGKQLQAFMQEWFTDPAKRRLWNDLDLAMSMDRDRRVRR